MFLKTSRYRLLTLVLWGGWASFATAQVPPRMDSAELQLAIKKLNVLSSVLYVGAHPDDENTRLIAYLTKGRLADTAYLSMTRGDGGQNRIGPEMREQLGIARTQELLAARRIDGGRQFFTRAIDFGYSKHPDETFRLWDREQVLADTVRVFREFQPDLVVTRFPTTAGTTHGHHTASALLAVEAFKAATDPEKFPESSTAYGVWRPKRLLWNTSPFFYRDRGAFDSTGLLTVNVGEYSPLLGESYSELAARSRSMHKSQGFGSMGSRGEFLEYFEHLEGAKATQDLFEGVNTSWSRLRGGEEVGEVLEAAYEAFEPENPSKVVPLLLEGRKRLSGLPESRWKNIKMKDLDQIIAACLGLFLEITAEDFSAVPGDKVKLNVEAVVRTPTEVRLERLTVPFAGQNHSLEGKLNEKTVMKESFEVQLPENLPDSQPYWLRKPGTLGMFAVDDPDLILLPENPPALTGVFELLIGGASLFYEKPVVYKWNDPVEGERYRPFEVIPAVSVNLEENVFVFADRKTRPIGVRVRSGTAGVMGTLRLEIPEGWGVSPRHQDFELPEKGQELELSFRILPPEAASVGTLHAVAEVGGKSYRRGLVRIEYDHLPTQVFLPAAEARLARLDLQRKGERLGYLQGAGDQVPEGLRQIGYRVDELSESDLTSESLKEYDAVILGVRAYNTVDRIRFYQRVLFDYVEAGGTLIVQYSTSYGMQVDEVAPYPLKISRDRVAVEKAEVWFLLPEHPVLNQPNRITQADFEGWVQERGLYFASEWDDHFEAILSSHDPGEPPRDGGLLVAKYGEGYFVYTGYSWFRQFPAGVPGAYRLFVNLISIGK